MGIPVRLHWTFLFIIPFVAWNFASFSQEAAGGIYGFGGIEPASLRWAYSLFFAILLFACVALHELGHSYMAHKNGIGIKSITLYFFGGVAAMEEIPRNPRLELQMAFAGPAVSGVVGLFAIYLAGPTAAVAGAGHPLAIMLWNAGGHEPHTHGLQSAARLSHGRGPSPASLVCDSHALCKGHPEGCEISERSSRH